MNENATMRAVRRAGGPSSRHVLSRWDTTMAGPRLGSGIIARTPRRSRTPAGGKAVKPLTPAQADRIQRIQLNELISWTVRERLRCLWYELRLAVREMNYATCRMIDCRVAAPLGDSTEPARDHD